MPLLALQRPGFGNFGAVPPTMPVGPHIVLVSAHGASVVRTQNGVTADVRLVRPVYPFTAILRVETRNTAATPTSRPYWGDRYGFLDTQDAADLSVNRQLSSFDDGDHPTHVYLDMSDSTVLSLSVALSVAPFEAGAAPPPSPPPPITSQVFFEDFAPRRGAGALWVTFGNAYNTEQGTFILDGAASAMTPVHPQRINDGSNGFPNGLFEFRIRYHSNAQGGFRGNGTGPATILWPADDVWPGTEIDLGEFFPNDDPSTPGGALYMATHWPINGIPGDGGDANDGDRIWVVQDNPSIAPGRAFDVRQWHVYAAYLQTNRTTFYVDGRELATVTDHPAPDFAHGGVNHTAGFLNASNDVALECDWVRWTPEAMVPNPVYPPGGIVP
jgi:hypothetical protein